MILQRKLGALRGKLRRAYAAHGAVLLIGAAAGIVLFSFVFDYLFHLPREVRLLLLLGTFGALAVIAYRGFVRPLRAPITDDDMALFYESAYPEAGHRLISAVQFSRAVQREDYPFSRSLAQSVIQEADEFAERIAPDVLRAARPARQKMVAGGVLSAAVVVLAFSSPTLFGIWLNRFFIGNADWPRRTTLVVEVFEPGEKEGEGRWTRWPGGIRNPGVVKVVRGDGLKLRARALKGPPERVEVNYRSGENIRSSIRVEASAETGRDYEWTFPQILEEIVFRVKGGDHETKEHRVKVLVPPRLTSVETGYEYPAYTGVPADRTGRKAGGDVEVIPGSLVLFFGRANVPLSRAWIEFEGKEIPLKVGEKGLDPAGRFRVFKPGKYRVHMVSRTGLKDREESVFTVSIRPDRAPSVRILRPGRDLKILPDSKIPIEIRIEDDFGVAGASLEVTLHRKQGEEGTESVPLDPPGDGGVLRHVLDPARWKLRQGDEVIYFARAWDRNDVAEKPGEGRSNPYRLTVVSREELEAEIDRLGKEVLRELEDLRNQQTRIREETVELGGRVRRDGRFTDPHTKLLYKLVMDQEYVGRRCGEIRGKLAGMIEDIRTFGLAQKRLLGHLQETEKLVRGIAEGKSPAAVRVLKASPVQGTSPDERIGRSAGIQGEILGDLTDAIALMVEFARLSDIVRGLRGVIEEQKRIRAEALEEYRRRRREKPWKER